nr:hypothetical protein [Tanacetum cinerariifolium]
MINLPACTCEAAKHYENHANLIKLMQFLMGLDDVYQPIRSNILTREPLPLVKTAFAVVSEEKSHRNVSIGSTSKPPSATAFAAKVFDNKNSVKRGNENNKNYVKRGPNPNMKCTNCNKDSHTVESCYDLIGYPSNYKKPGNQNASTFFNGSVKFNMNFKKYYNGKSNFISGNISIGWIVDSGANQHMIASFKFLINVVDVSNLGLTVGHPNGTKAKIVKIRDLKLKDFITLFNVLVPNPKRPDDEGRVPSNNYNIKSSPLNEGNDDFATKFIEDNAHPEGNTEGINQSDENKGESNHLFENKEWVDLAEHIDYDDVVEPVRRSSR